MIKIPLNNNKFTIVDDCMSNLLDYKWRCHRTGYVIRSYRKDNKKVGFISIHHCIIGYPLNNLVIDHIDNDKLNNQLNNLRIVSKRENALNTINRKIGLTSYRFPGIYWHKKDKRWRAKIIIDGKWIHIGNFIDEKIAADSYRKFIEVNKIK